MRWNCASISKQSSNNQAAHLPPAAISLQGMAAGAFPVPIMPDPSFFLPLVVQSAVLPFGLALAVTLALRKTPAAAAALAVALGLAASWLAVFHEQWTVPPRQALDWMPWILALAAAGALLAARLREGWPRAAARLLLALAVAALVAWPALPSAGPARTALVIAVAGTLTWLAWNALARAALTRPTPAVVLIVVAGGAGLAIMLDASQMIGQLAGGLAAAVAAAALPSLRRHGGFGDAAVGVATLALGALLLNATVYAAFPPVHAMLLAAGLLADAVLELTLRRRTASWLPAAALSVIPVALVLGLAIKAAQEYGGY